MRYHVLKISKDEQVDVATVRGRGVVTEADSPRMAAMSVTAKLERDQARVDDEFELVVVGDDNAHTIYTVTAVVRLDVALSQYQGLE